MKPEFAPESTWLARAMRELAEIDVEVAGEDLPPVSTDAKSEASRILSRLSRTTLIAPTIYPTLEGEVAIQFNAPSQSNAVVIELGRDGEAACFATVDGRNHRARYSDSSDLPDEFVEAQLSTLAPSSALGEP